MSVPPHVDVPRPVRVAAEWSWRLLVIAGAVVAVLLLMNRMKLVFLAVFVGLLLSALLAPGVRWTQRLTRGSRGLATALVLLVGLAGLAGIAALLTLEISGTFSDLSSQFSAGLTQIRVFVRDNFGIDDVTLQDYVQRAWKTLQDNRSSLLSGALSGATLALEVLSGAAVAFFTTVFFLLDGERIWGWCVSLLPRPSQADVRTVGARCWLVLTAYVRGTVLIAFTDGVAIGLAVAALGVPLAVPLGVLVFFGAFVPIVGAFVTGFVAVVVALAAKGLFAAVAVLVAILVVQQVEGHILQPLVMGRFVSLHPLGVVLAVTAGSVLAGLVGAVVAVPAAAVLTTVFGFYGRRARELDPAGFDPAGLDPAGLDPA